MSRPATTIHAEADVAEAGRVMDEKNVNRLPVVEGERLAGIITRQDVVRALATTTPV